ncbi:MAG: endonuclease III domain-containing protein [Defluviitaleaceae bacterium]|nr:endonuclease III domain-containing protein [Defluviitaleaceae bacterium]
MNAAVPRIYEKLLAHFGHLQWWPAQSPYEVMVGAVLTQNTAWRNVEKAIANFGGQLSPQFVRDVDTEMLIDIIRPAGFFNQKALYLKALTAWFAQYNYDISTAQREPPDKLRTQLLTVKGIGKETADCVLLYALGLPTFVVDAYTVRLCARYGLDAGDKYDAVKDFFEASLPRDATLFNNYHAAIVHLGKDFCRKNKPLCGACPLGDACARVGV